MAAPPAGKHLAHRLVRLIPNQALHEQAAVAIGAGATISSYSFEVTSPLSDRNSYSAVVVPDANARSAIGFICDVFWQCSRASTCTPQLGIYGLNVFRADAAVIGIAATTKTILGYRVAGSFVRFDFANTSALAGILDFGVYVRSL